MCKKCEIYFSENDELTELDIQQKCWRGDIIVKIGNKIFQPKVITPERLLSEFNFSINNGNIFKFDKYLILVKATNRESIISTLLKLVEINYFSKLNEVDLKQKYVNAFKELQELKNWVKVY